MLTFVWVAVRGRKRLDLTVQARLVVFTSTVLVVVGWVWFAAAEWHGALAGLGAGDRVVNALFQSVTLRTAGFNSVDVTHLAPITVLMMLVWMFIGASPGSTGGGIKTTTAAVLLGALPAVARGETRVVLLGRTVGLETVRRSAAIAVVGVLMVFAGAAALLGTQDLTLQSAVFEVFSAFGTVGLSLGATESLNDVGKLVVVGLMLGGRIGPLSLTLLLGRGRPSRVRYPEATIMVG